MINKGYKNNQAVSVINKVQGVDGSLPISADNTPVYMGESPSDSGSSNFGTPRASVKGGALVGNGSMYADLGYISSLEIQNFEFSMRIYLEDLGLVQGIAAINGSFKDGGDGSGINLRYSTTGTSMRLTLSESSTTENQSYSFDYSPYFGSLVKLTYRLYGGVLNILINDSVISTTLYNPIHFNNNPLTANTSLVSAWYNGNPNQIARTGTYIFDVKFSKLDLQGNFVQNLLHYKTQEGSGNTVYDSSGNGNHGTIVNSYAGMWGTQNVIGYADEEGFSNTHDFPNPEMIGNDLTPYSLSVNPTDLELSFTNEGLQCKMITNPVATNKRIYWYVNTSPFKLTTSLVGEIRYKMVFNATAPPTSVSFHCRNQVAINRSGLSNGTWYTDSFDLAAGGDVLSFVADAAMPNHPDVVGAYLVVDYVRIENPLIPKDGSITLPPFKDVLGNDLQYKGRCPSQAEYVESPCFITDGSAGIETGVSINALNFEVGCRVRSTVTSVTYLLNTYFGTGNYGFRMYINNPSLLTVLGNVYGTTPTSFSLPPVDEQDREEKYYDVKFRILNNTLFVKFGPNEDTLTLNAPMNTGTKPLRFTNQNNAPAGLEIIDAYYNELNTDGTILSKLNRWTLTEPIKDAANHTYSDVVGGNHATLFNGSLANEGKQDVFHYGELGYAVSDGINYYYDQALTQLVPINYIIPAHAVQSGKCAAYTTGGVLADLTVPQDGESFLGTCKLKHVEMARVVQADNGFWFTPTGISNTKELADFTGVIGDQLFSDVSESDRIRNIRTHKEALKSKQLVTEKKITKNL